MDSVQDKMLAELEKAIAEIPPENRGLKDFALIELEGEGEDVKNAKASIQSAAEFDKERLRLLKAARDAENELKGHGYPARPPLAVDQATLDIIDKQLEEMATARKRFTLRPVAASGTLEVKAGLERP